MELVQDEENERARFVRSNERRSNTMRLTINQILTNMQAVADLDYRGDLENNGVTIFDHLHDDDKKTFLRHSFKLLWEKQIELSQKGIVDIVIDDVTIDLQAVENERGMIDRRKEDQMDRLKHATVKWTYIAALFFATMVFLATFVYDPTGQNLSDFIKSLKSIVETVV